MNRVDKSASRPGTMWQHFPSLRFRLAAINFAVTTTILLATCGVFSIARSRELHRDMDERLLDRAATALDEFQRTPGPELDAVIAKTPSLSRYWIQIRAGSSQPLYRSKNLESRTLPLHDRTRARALEARPVCETITDPAAIPSEPGDVRLCTIMDRSRGADPVFIQVARSLEPVRTAVRTLRNTMLMVVGFGLAAAALASWYVTGRMLAPLRAIARRADRLSITSLGERLGGGGHD